jgi:hypothetical protein
MYLPSVCALSSLASAQPDPGLPHDMNHVQPTTLTVAQLADRTGPWLVHQGCVACLHISSIIIVTHPPPVSDPPSRRNYCCCYCCYSDPPRPSWFLLHLLLPHFRLL